MLLLIYVWIEVASMDTSISLKLKGRTTVFLAQWRGVFTWNSYRGDSLRLAQSIHPHMLESFSGSWLEVPATTSCVTFLMYIQHSHITSSMHVKSEPYWDKSWRPFSPVDKTHGHICSLTKTAINNNMHLYFSFFLAVTEIYLQIWNILR